MATKRTTRTTGRRATKAPGTAKAKRAPQKSKKLTKKPTKAARPHAARIVGAAYPSFYVEDLGAARAFYEQVLGPVEFREASLVGFRLGDTWLTLFAAKDGPHPGSGPRGAEFAIRVREPADVDALHRALAALGAKTLMPPQDTWMYERMRYTCLDDPFGIRIDVYCPLAPTSDAAPGGPSV